MSNQYIDKYYAIYYMIKELHNVCFYSLITEIYTNKGFVPLLFCDITPLHVQLSPTMKLNIKFKLTFNTIKPLTKCQV